MDNYKIFQDGVHSVLKVRWTLKCETPLVIRNGQSVTYKTPERSPAKSRGLNVTFLWEKLVKPEDTQKEENKHEHEVAALHYGYEIVGSEVKSYHFVPPSSIRGSLRSWTARYFGSSDLLTVITPIPQEQKIARVDYINNLRQKLEGQRNAYELIGSLFGLAFESLAHADDAGNAGRLQIETERFANTTARPISINGTVSQGLAGPNNARRQMTVRNPLDRVSHASKKNGGLHHFLEFCQGETFAVNLTILNPRDCDLGLLSLWKREMEYGLLRLGALSNIGRGRVSFVKKEESYTLWERPGASVLDNLEHFNKDEDLPENIKNDILVGFWQSYHLPAEKLKEFEKSLESYI